MKELQKAIKTTVIFLLAVALISLGLMELYFAGENDYYQDASARQAVAGTIDYLVVGSSHAQRGFDTRQLDEELGVNSYNLGAAGMPMNARYDLLQKEVARNPVKEVILEVSVDTLRSSRNKFRYEGNLYYMARMGSIGERVEYFLKYFDLADYPISYQFMINKGINSIKWVVKGSYVWESHNENRIKGFKLYEDPEPTDQTIDYAALYKSEKMNTTLDEENIDYLQKCVDLCKENGIKVRLVDVPVSRSLLCRKQGYDKVHSYYKEFAEENGIEYYSFNLLKNRDELFSDKDCFFDEQHLYNNGMVTFTEQFIDVIQKADAGEDVSGLFYDTFKAYEKTQDYYPKK